MLRRRSWIPSYCDGVVSFWRVGPNTSPFGAQINPSALSDMDHVCTLAFSESSMREQDFESARQRGANVATKVRTHLAPGPDAGCKAVIAGLVYDVSWIERTRMDMFVYLEGGRPLGDA